MDEASVLLSIGSEYRAALSMLRQAVERCPEELWLAAEYRNKFWHIAYHALFYTHLYLQVSEAEFRPWRKHQPDSNFLGQRPGAPNEPRAVVSPYSKADVLEYQEVCCAEVAARVPELKLDASSGFDWLPFNNKMELQLYNIRHLSHHTGQLADRIRVATGTGVEWVGWI